jgi:integrase
MSRKRAFHDGLPERVYERRGLKIYSIGYKRKDGTWAFRLQCRMNDRNQINRLRKEATKRALVLSAGEGEILTVLQLSVDWFKWQRSLPPKSANKRAQTTIDENEREAKTVLSVFGDMLITDIRPHHAYTYLEKCEQLNRGQKGNKEILLLQAFLKRAVRKGILDSNPIREVEKIPSSPSERYVQDDELELVLKVGARKGGQSLRASLALAMGYLCLRRPGEVLEATWSMVRPEGMAWTESKVSGSQTKRVVVISWTEKMKDILNQVMALDGYDVYPSDGLIFRTKAGTRYTKGGWKKTLGRLMKACEEEAKEQGVSFQKFNLQDVRPKGVTDKLEDGHTDVQNATLHRSPRMIDTVYDRRKKLVATPAQ